LARGSRNTTFISGLWYEHEGETYTSAMHVKNRRKIVGIVEELDVINRLEKGERIFYIFRNVRRARVCVRIIRVLIDLKKVLRNLRICVPRLPQSVRNQLY
jgi:hypothetical protein